MIGYNRVQKEGALPSRDGPIILAIGLLTLLGLALVLTAIGIGLTLGKKLGSRQRAFFNRPLITHLMTAMPIISAFVVMLAGALITYQALQQPGL